MEGAVLLDNCAGVVVEINGNGTVSLDCLDEVGSRSESWVISPSRIVRVRKGIILTLGLSIECSMNHICLLM